MNRHDDQERTADEMTRTAYHEAGHAVLFHALTLGCVAVSIVPDYSEMTAGATFHGGEWGRPANKLGEVDDDTANLRMTTPDSFFARHAMACFAGAEATRRWDTLRADWQEGSISDYRAADFDIYDAMGGSGDMESHKHLYAYTKRRTELLVENYWPEIDAVAIALLKKKILSGDDVRKFFRDSVKLRRGPLMDC